MEVVLFRARTRPDIDQDEYVRTFEEMVARAAEVPGFLGIDGFAGEDGSELAVVRFTSSDAVAAWRNHPEHVRTRERGRAEFFDSYEITVATVSRSYSWRQGEPTPQTAVVPAARTEADPAAADAR